MNTKIAQKRQYVKSLLVELQEVERQMERLIACDRARTLRFRQLKAQKSGIAREAGLLRRQLGGVSGA